ncbi:MAG TPA: TetR/AcrR family transcriptional regulator [Firmicutes bacterium]|nr:TetR/AcrR family transcriptional regulator [Bacillota bacterium]
MKREASKPKVKDCAMDNSAGNTQEKIIEAASKLMTEEGVTDTSLADIANEVGISRGTLFYYYSSKNDLVYDVAERNLDLITEDILSWIESIRGQVAPSEILKVAMERIVHADTRGKLHIYLLRDAASDAHLRERFQATYLKWKQMIEDALRSIYRDDRSGLDVQADIILSVIDGLTIQKVLGINDAPIERMARWLA